MSNVWSYMQGWSDTPLTQRGIAQGKQVAEALKNTDLLAMYTSTSERAYDTACLINAYHGLDIHMCKGLKEMNFGTLEAQPEHIVGGSPAHRINFDYRSFNGENIQVLTKRVRKALDEIVEAQNNAHGTILCVSHSIAISAVIRSIDKTVYAYRMKQEEYIDNCSVTAINYEDGRFMIGDINITDTERIRRLSL